MSRRPKDSPRASETLWLAVRELVRESGLKQVFIANQMGITEKHIHYLLHGKNAMTVDYAEMIVDVCRRPLRIDLEPKEWVRDVETWRQRAERHEAALRRVRELADRWSLPGHISMPEAADAIREALAEPTP